MTEQPKLPSTLTQASNFLMAYARWLKAGAPRRAPEVVEQLFDFCAECPAKQFIRINETTGRCADCGCWLRRNEGEGPNKLELPTEGCPRGFWHAQVEKQK